MKGVKMRFSLILCGFIFIVSPDISIFDFLPDVIGWLLIVLGITPFADIEMRAEDAKVLALRMILFSAVKMVLSLFTFRFGTADMLLVTFSYSIVELVTVIPFASNLFLAIDYSSMRLGVKLDSDKINSLKWFTYVFFFLKNALAFLPATVAFFDTESTGELSADTWFIDFEAAMRVFMVFAFFLSVVLSVTSLFYLCPFFARLNKNKELISAMINSRQETVLSQPKVMIKKNTGFVLTYFSFALLFFFDFYLDSLDILPTFVGFFLVVVASVFMKKRMKRGALLLTTTSAVGFAVSLITFLYKYYHGEKVKFVVDYAFQSKTFTIPLSALTAVFSAVVIFLIFKTAGEFNKEYTKTNLEENTVLFMIGGVVQAFFGFVLYAFPKLNTTFVFPSLIFGAFFLPMAMGYTMKLKKQISKDNR